VDGRIGKYRNKGDGMLRQSVRIALLVGTVAAVASAAPARAADQIATNGCCSPATRTICVTECVPETYTVKKICYTTEQKVEKYTAYRCETHQECRERTVCTIRRVQEMQEQCKKVCVRIPVCEDRTVMKPHYSYVTETKYVTKCVDRGHYECKEVYSSFKAFYNGLGSLCGRNSCCDPCGSSCGSCCAPSNCVTKKCWVPCMVQEQCPVTCCRKVCDMQPCVIKVNTCRTEIREEKCMVCVTKCIPETHVEKYTACVRTMVPYEACRTVCCRVPHEECVTCTRMVARTVTREVPCAPACAPACNTCNTCDTCGRSSFFSRFGSVFSRGGCGCGTTSCGCSTPSCGGGCSTGCGGSVFSGCFSGGLFNRGGYSHGGCCN
jgi:hypothetical protein